MNHFTLPTYTSPDFSDLANAPQARWEAVQKKGVAPLDFHAMSIFPEYFHVQDEWILPRQSRMDCVPVLRDNKTIDVIEFRNLQVGDLVGVGRTEDGSEGILVHTKGFPQTKGEADVFAFRTGRSRETAYSKDYDALYELLRHEHDHGHIVWVLGPAACFDHDSRYAMAQLIEAGFVHALCAGNALATHDLEGALYRSALGQDIYTQQGYSNGHYHHLDLINHARRAGSLEKLISEHNLSDGILHAALKKQIPVVLAGSIRDDGPLPSVIANVYEAQDKMREQARKATTVIALATQLHTIAFGNMLPSYSVLPDNTVRPVYIYSVDISEFAVNKLRDRGTLTCTSIVTNVQDFLVLLRKHLVS
ncbi:hypothetical protein GX645_05080 [Candidatus Sumerlaeota bacterium]|nr:hypothetical protein [Candidatus Sumerlaeota bacterium]